MTNEEAIKGLKSLVEVRRKYYAMQTMKDEIECLDMAIRALEQQPCGDWYDVPSDEMTLEQARQAVKDLRKKLAEHLEQEPCDDCISRQAVLKIQAKYAEHIGATKFWQMRDDIKALPPVTPQPKTGYCKECKYFERDSVKRARGIPFIIANEICKRWGNGCKTKENGYCFLFEPQESEVKE